MKVTGSKLIDSSIWLAYLFNGRYKDIIETEEIFLLSVLSLFEIKKKLMKSGFNEARIAKCVEFIKKKSLTVPVSAEIAERAVDISIEHNLGAVDSIIYATSLINKSSLFTMDNDFRGLRDVTLFEGKLEK